MKLLLAVFSILLVNSAAGSRRALEDTEDCTCCGGNDGCTGNLGLGDGDCDSHSDCAGDLLCGSNNCGDSRSTLGWTGNSNGFDLTDDCCYRPEDCTCCGGNDGCGGSLGLGDGDCDSHSDCAGDLLCGTNNCGDFRPTLGWTDASSGFDLTDDCCYDPNAQQLTTAETDQSVEDASSGGSSVEAEGVQDEASLSLPESASAAGFNTALSWDDQEDPSSVMPGVDVPEDAEDPDGSRRTLKVDSEEIRPILTDIAEILTRIANRID